MQATATPALSINQRNLYAYYLNHKKKYGNTPCFVPRLPAQSSRLEQYLQALVRLEEYGLIRVDRSSANYTAWIMLEPKNTCQYFSHSLNPGQHLRKYGV